MSSTNELIDGQQPFEAATAKNGSNDRSIFLDYPITALTLLCLVQTLFWTIMPALVDVAPPRDVVEGFMWGREWVLLTYKHPQLPAWLLEASHLLTGSFRWPQFLVSQLMVSATFVLVYLLANDMLGARRALGAVLLLPSVYFFGWPTPQFNHDYAQLPFWAGIAWLLWRAVRDSGPGWWLGLGLVAGAGLYAKFSTGLLIGFGGLWILYDTRARKHLATPWPWLGLAAFLGVVAPLLIELVRIDFLPLSYAAGRDKWVLANRAWLYYIGVQFSALIGFMAALGFAGLLGRKRSPGRVQSSPLENQALIYLLWMGIGPAALMMIASLFVGTGEAWGAPMYNLVGVIAVAILGRGMSDTELRKLSFCAAAFIVVMSSAYAGIRWSSCNLLGRQQPVCWPARAISEKAEAIWYDQVRGPLGIVAGDADLAALVGLNAKDKPSIFTELDYRLAPWITPQRLQEQGMLLVWRAGVGVPRELSRWVIQSRIRTITLDWSLKAPPILLGFAVVPPGAAGLPGVASGGTTPAE